MWPFTRKPDNRYNHVLTDEERERAIEVRKAKSEIIQAEKELKLLEIDLKRQELLNQIADISQEEEENPLEAMLLQLVMPQLANKLPVVSQPAPNQQMNSSSQPPETTGITISNEQIALMYERIPPVIRKQTKNMLDDELRTWIVSALPAINRESADRAIAFIRSKQ